MKEFLSTPMIQAPLLLIALLLLLPVAPVEAFLLSSSEMPFQYKQPQQQFIKSTISALPPASLSSSSNQESTSTMSVEDAIFNRYACTRFQPEATNSSLILDQAYQALDVARRSPSGFNAQPYKLLLVHDQEQKNAMSKFCCGHNAHRVRESVCTVLFLADRQVLRNWKDYQALSPSSSSSQGGGEKRKKKLANLKTMGYITLFSSGFPYLPQILAGPLSFLMSLGMRIVSWVFRSKLPVPTLTSSLAWSTKNTMLVAMSYMLACTSRGIATCPMEGYTTWGVRRALKIPRRYSIPLIVATGVPFQRRGIVGQDDVGMSHGPPSTKSSTPRFSTDDVIYGNLFGNSGSNLLSSSDL
jgi:nitroreductase